MVMPTIQAVHQPLLKQEQDRLISADRRHRQKDWTGKEMFDENGDQITSDFEESSEEEIDEELGRNEVGGESETTTTKNRSRDEPPTCKNKAQLRSAQAATLSDVGHLTPPASPVDASYDARRTLPLKTNPTARANAASLALVCLGRRVNRSLQLNVPNPTNNRPLTPPPSPLNEPSSGVVGCRS